MSLWKSHDGCTPASAEREPSVRRRRKAARQIFCGLVEDPRWVHNSWRPTCGYEALRRRQPRPSWLAVNEEGWRSSRKALHRRQPRPSWLSLDEEGWRISRTTPRRHRPRPPWSAPNETAINQEQVTLDAQQLAPSEELNVNGTASNLDRQRIRRRISEMDLDSDMPLSNLASMGYLRREIAKFGRLVVERTA